MVLFPRISSLTALLLLASSAFFGDVLVQATLDEPFSSSFSQLEHAPCTRLFTRNGQMGCGTESRSVDVGKLVYYEGSLPSTDENYVSVVEDYDLTAETLDTLLQARGGLLKGILVLNSTSSSSSSGSRSGSRATSPDSVTPQGSGTPSYNVNYGYSGYKWNSKGEGLFGYDLYGVAMALVPDSDVAQSIRQNALGQSAGGSKADIVAEFNYYMGPESMNSQECLAWNDASSGEWKPKCLPLGGTSVWAVAGSPPNPSSKRPVILLSAAMDSTSLFHDIAPGANTAASNILTVLMAAKLIGTYVKDEVLDALPNAIALALFQGETYGFLGSRSFLRDLAYPGFQCNGTEVQSSHHDSSDSASTDYACLHPLRPSLKFANLGQVQGMLSVDQVGHAVADGILYVHADENNDSTGSWLANLLKYSSTNKISVASSSAGSNNNNDNGFPYPPSPLTSLLQLSEGAVGGAVLTGYDYSFTSTVAYHSHSDSASLFSVELDSIAAAATMMARAALAFAYDDGTYSGSGDYSTPTTYANDLIPELDASDEVLAELANCFFYDGQCELIRKYSSMEAANEKARTGIDVSSAQPFGTPPSYFVGVYNYDNGQPFVRVGDKLYGAYPCGGGDCDYGKKNSDAVTLMPRQMESALHGLFNDFLGRGSVSSNGDNYVQDCTKAANCANVGYCEAYGDSATCTGGGKCVCKRAHYHMALDEALMAAPNEAAGFFVVDSDKDAGISPMYTEPFWSGVGIRVYRDVGPLPGVFTLVAGLAVGAASLFGALVLKHGLKKEKLY